MAADTRPLLAVLAIFGLLVTIEVSGILWLNGGTFTYTLDDAYIHLALAENLVRGHYGINLSEPSAPSSSILWPFLLAPSFLVSSTSLLPLFFNVIAGGATLAVFWRFSGLVLEEAGAARQRGRFLLTLLLMLATNLTGLVFTGMEHSAQILCTAAVVIGLVMEIRTGTAAWWLIAAIIVGPLFRYENLAVSVPAVVFLLARRHAVRAGVAMGVMALTVVGFSLFLRGLGLGWLPTSVSAKSRIVESGGSPIAVLYTLTESLKDPRGILLAIALVVFAAVIVTRTRNFPERLLAACVATGILLHLLAGRYGWYSRYEVYIWTATLMTGIYLARRHVVRFLEEAPLRTMVMATGGTLLICSPYVYALLTTPLAARNIHEQHGQMHRFVTGYYAGPVAANDIGLISLGRDAYVLDIAGLGSREVLQARRDGRRGWLHELADRHGVKLALVYAHRMPEGAAGWVELGTLSLGGRRITAAHEEVAFLLREGEPGEEIARQIEEWAAGLPPGVRFTFAPGPGEDGPPPVDGLPAFPRPAPPPE